MADPASLTQSSTESNSTSSTNPLLSNSTTTEKERTTNDNDLKKSTPNSSTPSPDESTAATSSGTTQSNILKTYSTVKSKLPASISSKLPTDSSATTTIASISTKLSNLSSTSSVQLNELKKNAGDKYDELMIKGSNLGLKEKVGQKVELSKDQFLTQAWSVENGTEVVLNVSLNQVSPLFYEVLPPNAVFERRVPNVWFTLSITPYTTPSSALTSWDVTWPILALTGPVAATISILAIPFVALAAGGTALSSLTGFGTAVSGSVAGSVSTVGKTGASAVALVGRVSKLPGGQKLKTKLTEAGKKLLYGTGGEMVREKVVKYLAGAAIGTGVAAGTLGQDKVSTDVEVDLETRKREKLLEERKGKKFEEVDVTGYELIKVLKCETGKKSVDHALINAFNRLSFKAKGFKTSENPVLRIAGGPELEERGTKQYLVFYPFIVEKITNISVVPIPISEVAPTTTEEALIRDTKVVESTEEAETASLHAPLYRDGDEVAAKKELEEKEKKEEKEAKGSSWWGF